MLDTFEEAIVSDRFKQKIKSLFFKSLQGVFRKSRRKYNGGVQIHHPGQFQAGKLTHIHVDERNIGGMLAGELVKRDEGVLGGARQF